MKAAYLPRFGPTFRKGERASAEGLAFALALPRLALGLMAVDGQPCAERRDEQRAHAVRTRVRTLVRLSVDEKRFTDVVPGQRNLAVEGGNMFGPEVSRVAGLAERSVRDGNRQVLQLGIQHALYGLLQPAGHGDVVGIDAPAALGQLALEIEHVARPHWTMDDAPVARVGRIGIAVLARQPDERILPCENRAIGVCNAHSRLPFRNSPHRVALFPRFAR